MTSAYPLTWPDTIPRSTKREAGQFKTSLPAALKNVEDSLRRFGSDSGVALTGVVLSSNVTLGQSRPSDPGVAAWFTWDGQQVCIPVDRYASVEANLQAIHHIIEARRTELRHGTLALVRASFRGFLALPGAKSWRDVLGFDADSNPTHAQVDAAYRAKARKAHPDQGGPPGAMAELNAARDAAIKHIGEK